MAGLLQINCCGVEELVGVSYETPANVLYEIGDNVSSRNVVITDIEKNKRRRSSGWGFAKFVAANGLGVVTGPSPAGRNPSTGNRVYVWIWTPNAKAVQKWLDKEQECREADWENYK